MARAIAEPLLAWFDVHKRDLPWRRTSDPYRIWVSEIMLQQTQVDRVIEYYERFLDAFPTVQGLAEAGIDDVLRQWEGLGYYSRARNLLAAAQTIVVEHGGEFPSTFEEVRALPGVGEYTAGAVLSIAFGERVPAPDANAIRVIARLFAVAGDVSKGEARRAVIARAADAVPGDRPGDFNQALMELGALICIAGRPGCLICPLTEVCAAKSRGLQDSIPPPKSQAVREVAAVAGVVQDGRRVLVARRPLDGKWGGLWEFPNTHLATDEEPVSALREHLCRAFGLKVQVGEELAAFTYGVMNRRVPLTVLSCALESGDATASEHDEARWATIAELAEIALPSPHRTIAEMLLATDA